MSTPSEPVAPADDPSAPYRLPRDVEPVRYEVRVAPDIEAATFSGDVRIEGVVSGDGGGSGGSGGGGGGGGGDGGGGGGGGVTEIVLNAVELTIEAATVTSAGTRHEATVSPDVANERLVLGLPAAVAQGPVTIEISFAGTLNDKLQGFYRSTFSDADGGTHTVATTQFEATDARRAFPCFDEPDRKAVFAITIDVPAGLRAWSNEPVVHEEELGGGRRRVRFGDTMKMSTYLVAFVVGPLEQTEPIDVDGVALTVIHAPGKGHLAGFALECGAHALRFFREYFGIDYPATKLDLVAIPDFAFGAMENLGCVTFREALLMIDPANATRIELQRVADVISHEIAHMWFGDLVTMRWWNGIWLNEAFATLMELLCVDHLRPDWERFASFGLERSAAMATDALHSTRPIEFPVASPDEAQQMFDVLTYEKGAAVLRMLEQYLGHERFRDGIRLYLHRHAYANTDTADLWNALEEASGEPVRAIMDTWILQGGFPEVTVELPGATSGEARGALSQRPFMYAPAVGETSIGSLWQIPVQARSLGGEEERVILGADPVEVAPAGKGPVVVNAGGWGFFRVRYQTAHVQALAANLGALESLERINLLSDTWAGVVAGQSQLPDFTVLVEALGDETHPDVWAQVTAPLAFLDRAVPDEARPLVAAYTRALMRPLWSTLGWQAAPGESERVALLRAQVLAVLGTVGDDSEIQGECVERHDAFLAGRATIDPTLQASVVAAVAAHGGEVQFDAFVERYRHPATPQEETRYLYALAGFEEIELAERAFEMAATTVRTQNAPMLLAQMLANRSTGETVWRLVAANWDDLLGKYPMHIVPRMVDGVRLLCRDLGFTEEVRDFLAAHPVPAGQRQIDQTTERMGINSAFARRLADTSERVLAAGVGRLGAGGPSSATQS